MTVNESTVRWKPCSLDPSADVQVSPSTADVQVTVRCGGDSSAVTDCPYSNVCGESNPTPWTMVAQGCGRSLKKPNRLVRPCSTPG